MLRISSSRQRLTLRWQRHLIMCKPRSRSAQPRPRRCSSSPHLGGASLHVGIANPSRVDRRLSISRSAQPRPRRCSASPHLGGASLHVGSASSSCVDRNPRQSNARRSSPPSVARPSSSVPNKGRIPHTNHEHEHERRVSSCRSQQLRDRRIEWRMHSFPPRLPPLGRLSTALTYILTYLCGDGECVDCLSASKGVVCRGRGAVERESRACWRPDRWIWRLVGDGFRPRMGYRVLRLLANLACVN